MELDSFIEQTLTGITSGITRANNAVTEEGRPKLYGLEPGAKESSGGGVEFDIAVTVGSEAGAKGSGKIKVAVVEASIEGGDKEKWQTVSRVKFCVCVKNWHE